MQRRIVTAAAVPAAVVAGWQIADGSFGPIALLCALGLLLGANFWTGISADALVMGGVLVGYLVGNRGFAQLHPPNVPLLPAEAALGLALACGAWRWARSQQLPFRRDALNGLILLWILVTLARLPNDFRQHRILALRDFAMVYYALFFFLGQAWSGNPVSRRWLVRCLTAGLACAAPVFAAFLAWPEWFGSVLTIAGVPLVFVKSDVAGGFMAAGVFWFAIRFAERGGAGWLLLSLASLIGVALSNSRAALVSLGLGLLVLLGLQRWKILRVMSAFFALGVLVLAGQAAFSSRPIQQSLGYRVFESALSIADFTSNRTYLSSDLGDKSDNNQFRLVWWRSLATETWDTSPLLGLGFGHDLANDFARIYYAGANEDFSARSPHNFLLSVFARTGAVGLALLLAALGFAARATWVSQVAAPSERRPTILALWLLSWSILASACFGVVLEGPMGGVVFWTALGLANGLSTENADGTFENPEESAVTGLSAAPERHPLATRSAS